MVVKSSCSRCVLRSYVLRTAVLAAVAANLGSLVAPLGADENIPERIQKLYAEAESSSTIEQQNRVLEKIERLREGKLSTDLDAYLTKLEAWLLHQRGEAFAKRAAEANRSGDLEAGRELDTKAMEDFDAAIKLAPKRWKSYHHRGVCYALLGEYKRALSDFSQTITLRPEYANAWFNRGEIQYQLGQFSKAIADYTEAIERQPQDAGYYSSRGHTYFELRESKKALRDYNQAVSLGPENSEFIADRGEAFCSVGQWDKAADDFRRAISLDSSFGRAYQGAAWLMATCPDPQFRNSDLAIRSAEKAIELDGDSDYIYLDTLAAALANGGQFKRAQAVLRQSIEAAPSEHVAPLKRRLRRYQARQPYRQSVESIARSPDHPTTQ